MRTSVIESTWIAKQALRLDASIYDPDFFSIFRVISKYPQKTTIGAIARVWMPGRFKRYRVQEPEYGVPFLTASEILLAKPTKVEFISQKLHHKEMNSLIPKQGTILVTRSGTIGKCAIVSKSLSEFAISEDAVRVELLSFDLRGYLYICLSSKLGQTLLTHDTYGSVIDHIEPFHIERIEIPLLPESTIATIHEKGITTWEKREQANQLLNAAQQQLLNTLQLTPLNPHGLYQQECLRTFHLQDDQLDFRLDASHYDPPGRQAIHILEKHPDCRLLGDVTERIFHPFRMNMVLVEKGYGVPFLGGGDIIQLRYYDDKYISPVTENYEEFILKRGWTLMTIGGTIGRLTYVGDYLNGFAASQHVTRIVPNQNSLLPGYLYAFMETEYAQEQVKNLVYGSVVDTIRESQLRELCILVPELEKQQPIHDSVEEAYRLRYEANCLEDDAQALLIQALGIETA